MEALQCKDLMICDWIQDYTKFPMQVRVVGEDYLYADFEGNVNHMLQYDDKTDPPYPIPLTEEILKKNGWEQDTPGVLWHKDLDFCIDYWKETFWCSAMNGLHLDYVHKLQQLIRLSGFTEIANNFKL